MAWGLGAFYGDEPDLSTELRGAYAYLLDFFTYWNFESTAVDELHDSVRRDGSVSRFDTITRQTFTLVEMALAPQLTWTLAFRSNSQNLDHGSYTQFNLKESLALLRPSGMSLLPGLVSGEVGVGEWRTS